MKHFITTEITINAPVHLVWSEFINFEAYPTWNPFIHSVTGELAVGQTIKAKIGNMSFSPIVKEHEVNSRFSWQGKLGIRGIFDGKHLFELKEMGENTTLFTQSEKFNGLLVPFMKKKLNSEIKNGFEAMNFALKQRCEEKKEGNSH